ncbi:MAG: cytochrome c biogenesis protein CcsA [Anaerolineaceae bacterium]|nr:cytochrome c biogenesis protein CcsA [Anaerolineaceae bacterium]
MLKPVSKKTPVFLILLDVLAGLAVLVALWMALVYAPQEVVMGNVQRLFYFHVATGWTGMLGYLLAVVAGIGYLRTRSFNWDVTSYAGVEIGLVFTGLCVISGSFWARPIWNTWWTWDPRLTTAFIMELLYLAYLMLRSGLADPQQRARFSAVYAIIGFVTVPLTFLSIRIFRTIHPVVVASADAGASGAFNMSPRMTQTFLFSLLAFTLLFVAYFWHRYRLGVNQTLREQAQLAEEEE